MLAAAGWGALMPPVSSPLATRLRSSLCLSRMAALDSSLSCRKEVLAEQEAEGPWDIETFYLSIFNISYYQW